MNTKKFFLALGLTASVFVMIFGGYYTASFLLGSNGETDVGLDAKIPDQPVNVLLMGLDEDKTRSDVMMLVCIQPKAEMIKVLSITRDTRVQVDGHSIKINAAMGYKRRQELAIEKVRALTGLPIHHYMVVNFEGFRNVVDILGGVDFDVPVKMDYDDPVQNLHIHVPKGMQHLDGKTAEGVVRFRDHDGHTNYYPEGDPDRIKVQQQFLKALFAQKLDPKYIGKVGEILGEVSKHVETDLSLADMLAYAPLLNKLKEDSIFAAALPGEGRYIGGVSYFIHDEKATRELVEKEFRYDVKRAPPEPSASPDAP
jgi:LCP family protein required for cell wall assembly